MTSVHQHQTEPTTLLNRYEKLKLPTLLPFQQNFQYIYDAQFYNK